MKVLLAVLVNLLISGESLRFMLMPLIPTIAMEWFQESNELTIEFKSALAIKLKQVFVSGSVNIVE